MSLFTLAQLEAAVPLVRTVVPPTPLYAWPLLAKRTGAQVWVKHENHTPIGAFKVRGGVVYLDALRRRGEALEHTADVGIRVTAASVEQLFADAGQAIASLIVENVDAIAAVPGVDGLFIGPGDLGLRLKLAAGEMTLESAFQRTAESCKRHGKAPWAAGMHRVACKHKYMHALAHRSGRLPQPAIKGGKKAGEGRRYAVSGEPRQRLRVASA